MIRYGEATLTTDNEQRRIPLTVVSSSGNTYHLAIPGDPGIALPGPYMLFALSAIGTPSISRTISVSTPQVSTPTSTYGKRIAADGPALYWPLSGTGSSASADFSSNRDTAAFTTSGIT